MIAAPNGWSQHTRDVAMYRHGPSWTYTRPGYWSVYLMLQSDEVMDFFQLGEHEVEGRLAVVDDFGTLVPVDRPE